MPDCSPNAVQIDDAIDNTASYVNRFHTVTMDLDPNRFGTSLPSTLRPMLRATTLLWSLNPGSDRWMFGPSCLRRRRAGRHLRTRLISRPARENTWNHIPEIESPIIVESTTTRETECELWSLQFARDDLADTVAAILNETEFPGKRLVLELTESIVVRDFHEPAQQMRRLKRLLLPLSATVQSSAASTDTAKSHHLGLIPIR